jgi:hypothetical protein
MTIGSRKLQFRVATLVALVALVPALAALYGACATEGDDDQDVITGCTLESCMTSCLASGLPGGRCDGNLCLCDPPLPDADADADADVEDVEDVPTDRTDVRDVRDDGRVDVEIVDGETADGETVDGETVDGDTVEVVEDVGPEDVGPRCTTLATAWTFNSGASGWTHEAVLAPPTGSFDPWELGTPSAGPEACHGSAATNLCWATGLDDDYPHCQRGAIRSPTLDLAPCSVGSYTVDLVFWHWYDFAAGTGSLDGGVVELTGDDGATWTAVAPSAGWDGAIDMDSGCEGTVYTDGRDGFLRTSGRWVQETIRVPVDLRTAGFAVRFVFGSDSATTAAGWFVDDVALVVR